MPGDVADRADFDNGSRGLVAAECATWRNCFLTGAEELRSAETYRMELSNGALIHFPTRRIDPADLVVTLTRPQLLSMLGGAGADGGQMEGDAKAFATIAGFATQSDTGFAVVCP